MKVYLAGPMTGYENFNFPAFFEAEATLQKLGYEVVNPARNDGANVEDAVWNATHNSRGTWSDYMRIDLKKMLDCEAIVCLPGSMTSRGAKLECHVAIALGMPTWTLRQALEESMCLSV